MPDSGRRLIPAAAVAVACSGLLATSAFAAPILGTPGNDRIRGTAHADDITAREGDDRVFARRGNDSVDLGPGADRAFGGRGGDGIFGGPGPDRIWGNRGADTLRGDADDVGDLVSQDRLHGGLGDDTLFGGDGQDFLTGGFGDDTQEGGAGNDTIFANQGRDHTEGGPGNDRLWALSSKDVSGPDDTTGDLVRGGEGDDRIAVRDGERDVVSCGPGIDRAILDFKDAVEDNSCEVVSRKAPRRADSRVEDRNDGSEET
jgi:Ca2+-binding RTX toxin-like protein